MQTEHDHEQVMTEFDCAVCGYEQIAVRSDSPVPCPDCEESYSLVLRDGFALVETNGWIIGVTIDPRADPMSGTAGG